jgi:hypothetical protein
VEFRFYTNGKKTPHHVADFDIVFDDGDLAGLKLVGGALWVAKDGGTEILVTLPARKIAQEGKERYYDLLRSVDKNPQTIKNFKTLVATAYRARMRHA